jgi:hypothetical protein
MVTLAALPKKHLTLKEAANLLSVSEEFVRLKVRQRILKPLNCGKHYGNDLFFKAEDILGIWESFLLNDQSVRDALKYLVQTQREVLKLLGDLN